MTEKITNERLRELRDECKHAAANLFEASRAAADAGKFVTRESAGARAQKFYDTSAALDELLRAREADRWQPIETAPSWGSVVLFCDAHGNRWTDVAADMWPSNGCGYPPTHWRPLPAPPQAVKAATVDGIECMGWQGRHPSGLDADPTTLNPCKHCGHHAAYRERDAGHDFCISVECVNTSCGIRTPEHYKTRETAAKAWNRVSPQAGGGG